MSDEGWGLCLLTCVCVGVSTHTCYRLRFFTCQNISIDSLGYIFHCKDHHEKVNNLIRIGLILGAEQLSQGFDNRSHINPLCTSSHRGPSVRWKQLRERAQVDRIHQAQHSLIAWRMPWTGGLLRSSRLAVQSLAFTDCLGPHLGFAEPWFKVHMIIATATNQWYPMGRVGYDSSQAVQ